MSTQEKTWNVANRLHSQKDSDNPEVNHIIAGADEIYDDAKGAKQSDINAQTDAALADRYTKSETYSKEQLNSLVTTPDVNYVSVVGTNITTSVTDILPVTGEANTIYRVGNWNGTQYDPTMYALFAWNGTTYVCLAVRSFVGEVYDVSVNHPDGQGKPTPYADLAAALGTNGANVPADIRRGGMSIKFIQGTVQSSDNKYVQYRLLTQTFSTNTANWEADNRSTGIDEGSFVSNDEFVSIKMNNGDDVLEIDSNNIKLHKPLILSDNTNIEDELEKTKYIESKTTVAAPLESITLETDTEIPCGEIVVHNDNNPDVDSDYLDAIEFGDTLIITNDFIEAKKPIRLNKIHIWLSKIWATVGDSLVEYNLRSSKFVQQYIQDYTGIGVQNVGRSGRGFVGGGYLAEINSITGTPDVITIQSSGNDIHHLRDGLPLGNITDSTTASYCGYINIVLDKVFELFPTVPLGCITSPPWRAGYPGGEDKLFENMCNTFLEICYNRGIPTLDLFHTSNLHPEDIHYRALVYDKDTTCKITTSDDPTAILVTAENIDDLQALSDDVLHIGDYVTNAGGVHPNEIGHALMAPRVKQFLEKLILL